MKGLTETVYCEDCRTTMRRVGPPYHYVFFVPPDFNDLGLDPLKDDLTPYWSLLKSLASNGLGLKPKSGVVTVGITDRKCGGQIIPKHAELIRLFESYGYRLIFEKIWCKSLKVNWFYLNFTHILTFASGHFHGHKPAKATDFDVDVWMEPHYRFRGYPYKDATALAVVKRCILRFTKPGQTVYDPCFGSGTTGIACLQTGRGYIGSEIRPASVKLAKERIAAYKHRAKGVLWPNDLVDA